MSFSDKLTFAAGRASLVLKKHAPDILFGAGIVGMAGSIYLAVQAGKGHDAVALENELTMEETKKHVLHMSSTGDYSETQAKQDLGRAWIDTAVNWAKLYGPAIGAFGLSAASLTMGHLQNKQRTASAVAAYTLLSKGFKDYRGRVIEKLGVEADEDFRFGKPDKVAYEEIDEVTGRTKKIKMRKHTEAGGYAVTFDEYNINWRNEAHLNQYYLKAVQSQLNDRLRTWGHLFLNEVYDALSIDRIPEGQMVGWVYDDTVGETFVDLGLFAPMNQAFMDGLDPSCIIDPNVQGPIYDLL